MVLEQLRDIIYEYFVLPLLINRGVQRERNSQKREGTNSLLPNMEKKTTDTIVMNGHNNNNNDESNHTVPQHTSSTTPGHVVVDNDSYSVPVQEKEEVLTSSLSTTGFRKSSNGNPSPLDRQSQRQSQRQQQQQRRSSQGLVLIGQCIEGLTTQSQDFRSSLLLSSSSFKDNRQQQEQQQERLNNDESMKQEETIDEILEEENLPLLSYQERCRDKLLYMIDTNRWILYLNCFVLFLVVASGALWFFFLLGWQTLCEPARDCGIRNTVYNVSIHILTGLFTYMSTIVMPWRWTHTLHSLGWSCPYRSNAIGYDLYGLSTNDPWFHVPSHKRLLILFFLLFNCFFQYINQICRGIYYSYNDSSTWPGNLMTGLFFGLSMIWALIGALLFWKHTSIVRQTDKERFGPGPIDMIQQMWHDYHYKTQTNDNNNNNNNQQGGSDGDGGGGELQRQEEGLAEITQGE